jgi:predicted DNA binding protein
MPKKGYIKFNQDERTLTDLAKELDMSRTSVDNILKEAKKNFIQELANRKIAVDDLLD